MSALPEKVVKDAFDHIVDSGRLLPTGEEVLVRTCRGDTARLLQSS
jgi:hypothetical protein